MHVEEAITLQWGHVFSDVEIADEQLSGLTGRSFNGATSFQTWKLLK